MTRSLPPLLLALLLASCAGPAGRRLSADEYDRLQRELVASEAARGPDAAFSAGRADLHERQVELQRREDELSAEQARLTSLRAQLELQRAQSELEQALAVTRAERALSWARDDVQRFDQVETPLRLAEQRLHEDELSAAADESRSELAQLELLYAEDELAAATSGLVLERARQRLRLDETRLELARRRGAELAEHVLPRQRAELLARVAEAETGLQVARHAREAAALRGEGELAALEQQWQRVLQQRDDLGRARASLTDEVRRFERDTAARGLGP